MSARAERGLGQSSSANRKCKKGVYQTATEAAEALDTSPRPQPNGYGVGKLKATRVSSRPVAGHDGRRPQITEKGPCAGCRG